MVPAASVAPDSVQEGSWHCCLALMHCPDSVRSTKWDRMNDPFVLTPATEEYSFFQPVTETGKHHPFCYYHPYVLCRHQRQNLHLPGIMPN